MASGDQDVVKVSVEDLLDPEQGGLPGATTVKVDGLEDDRPKPSPEPERQENADEIPNRSEPKRHETPKLDTTVVDEEDENYKPTIKDRVKGKLLSVEAKLRPKDATAVKAADPHPNLS